MRKYKSNYCKPYIKKATPKDISNYLATGDTQCWSVKTINGKTHAYALVARGTDMVYAIARSKEEIKKFLIEDKHNGINREFNDFCNHMKYELRKVA